MTKLLLALMASAGVSAAALAQQQYPSQPPAQNKPDRTQPAPGERAQPQIQQRPTVQRQMSPRALDANQIRQIQQALNDKGMKLGVDGVWGRRSDMALRNFQRRQGMAATGQLDPQTRAALGTPLRGEGETPSPPSVSPGAPPSGPQQPQQPQQQRAPEPPTAPGTRPQ